MPSLEKTQEQILEALRDEDRRRLGRPREIKELPKILSEDEIIENIVRGFYSHGLGILVATNRRLVFIDKGIMGGVKVEDFPYEKISSIQYETGMLQGEITVFTSGNKATISNIGKNQARNFGEFARAKISSPKSPSDIISDMDSLASSDVLTKLERLAKLKEQGILDDEEFKDQKRKIPESEL